MLKLPKITQEKLLTSAKIGMAEEILPLIDDERAQEELIMLIEKSQVTTSREMRQIVRSILDTSKDKTESVKRCLPENDLEYERCPMGDAESPLLPYQQYEVRQHVLDRAFGKYIASLKLCMTRMDEVLDSLDKHDEWSVWEALLQHRKSVHSQIDSLIKLKRKTKRLLENASHSLP